MPTYFISDLHLSTERPAIIELLLRFFDECSNAEHLYILGDLFEAWIGDDYIEPALIPVLNAMQKFSRTSKCFIMHGNRDFLIANDFEARTGFELLADEHIIDLHGTKTLLLHGDTLCTDDTEYQTVRRHVRSKKWKIEVLALSVQKRLDMAKQFRQDSDSSKLSKSEFIMDVNQQAVIDIMSQHQVSLLIHGHTHRLATHELRINNEPAKRIVLGDWYQTSSILICDKNGQRFC